MRVTDHPPCLVDGRHANSARLTVRIGVIGPRRPPIRGADVVEGRAPGYPQRVVVGAVGRVVWRDGQLADSLDDSLATLPPLRQ